MLTFTLFYHPYQNSNLISLPTSPKLSSLITFIRHTWLYYNCTIIWPPRTTLPLPHQNNYHTITSKYHTNTSNYYIHHHTTLPHHTTTTPPPPPHHPYHIKTTTILSHQNTILSHPTITSTTIPPHHHHTISPYHPTTTHHHHITIPYWYITLISDIDI